ncbi:DUF418 domain-containing protein [Gracilibacillus sp. YIM 98692]|uniref:DUF418 domain-containing protein n=1 Tax=Gracilibacillus sp. YIM 98692 TaxID=2663532 RepID=UPI0013D109B4|nr:DUF418 domain-containing protein [Gracilibacillus sp. YIM 98692]
MSSVRPFSNHQRLPWIDAARGFAIFGIFMVNLPAFHGPYFLYGNGQNYWGTGDAGIWQIIIDIFFQASFYSLFSFLFGFGIQIIYENAKNKLAKPRRLLVRRLLLLLLFGCIHAFLIWYGDILITYSLIGLILLLFIHCENKTLWTWSLCLLLIPMSLFTGLMYLARDFIDTTNVELIERAYQHYGGGGWGEILRQNMTDWLFANNVFAFILMIANILPIFLIGMLFARNKWLHDIKDHQNILKRVWLITLIGFVLFKVGPYFIGNPLWLTIPQDMIGGTMSAIFYMLTIALTYSYISVIFRLFSYVGKMALTNYILQSIIGVLLFYSVGLGWYGSLTPFETIAIAFVVFPLQIIWSYVWLRKWRRGPLEWLWRKGTYGRIGKVYSNK